MIKAPEDKAGVKRKLNDEDKENYPPPHSIRRSKRQARKIELITRIKGCRTTRTSSRRVHVCGAIRIRILASKPSIRNEMCAARYIYIPCATKTKLHSMLLPYKSTRLTTTQNAEPPYPHHKQ